MRSETGIIKTFRDGFWLSVFPIKSGGKRYWTAKISNKDKRLVKEFFDSNRGTVKFKGLLWIATQQPITMEELVEKFNFDAVKNL